jgi:hypothetical protein
VNDAQIVSTHLLEFQQGNNRSNCPLRNAAAAARAAAASGGAFTQPHQNARISTLEGGGLIRFQNCSLVSNLTNAAVAYKLQQTQSDIFYETVSLFYQTNKLNRTRNNRCKTMQENSSKTLQSVQNCPRRPNNLQQANNGYPSSVAPFKNLF